jgi:hypothetical protein
MAVNLSPVGGVAAQFFTNDGVPLAGGLIYTYLAGTNTPAASYTTNAGTIAHSNPIVLDSAGRVPTGEIWLTDGISYKFVLSDANDTLLATYDNIVGINSNFINYTGSQEIQTATAGQTVFTLTTMQYQPGTGSLSVFVDGVNQYGPGAQYAYVETSGTVVTFASGLHVGASIKFTTTQINASSYGDAFQISYTPPFTNSVATNVGDKLSQYVSVVDFGAVGDGVTDDTTAFVAALAASNAVMIPANFTMKITSQIALTSSKTIYGMDRFSSVIYADIDDYAIHIYDAGAAAQLSISSLTLQGNVAKANSAGIYVFGPTVNNLQNLRIKDFSKQAVTFVQSVSSSIKSCLITNVGTGVQIDAGATFSVSPSIVDVYVSSATNGVYFKGQCVSAYMENFIAEGCTKGIYVDSSVGGLCVNPFFEVCTTCIDILNSSAFRIVNPRYNGTTPYWKYNYNGSVPYYQTAQVVEDSQNSAVGGSYRDSPFGVTVINTFQSVGLNVRFDNAFWVNPNPGNSAPTQIQILIEGLYEIDYFINVRNFTSATQWYCARIVADSVEIPGTYLSGGLENTAAQRGIASASRKVLKYLDAGTILTLQYAASNVDMVIDTLTYSSLPSPTTNGCAGITVRHTNIVT